MITIKESNIRYPHHAEQSLNRIDAFDRKGIDIFTERDIKFVSSGNADYGISWHGEPVPDIPLNKTILYKAEPPIYNLYFGRKLNDPDFMKQYMAVISDYIIDDFPIVHCNLSLEFDFIQRYLDQKKTEFLCMVLRNKTLGIFLNSLIPSLRKYKKYSNMKIRKMFDEDMCNLLGPEKYHSYGRGWNRKCFRGEVGLWGNLTIFSLNKFTLSLENSCINGYVTEKMLYPMFAGSIPIYFGAPDVEKYVSKDTFIDIRKFNNRKELVDYLVNMPEKEYNRYLKNIKRFITSEESKSFFSTTFAKKIISIIEGGEINVGDKKDT